MTAKLQERLAFVTANFVARAGNYETRPFDWGKCHNKTVETFTVEEMESICAEIAAADFRYIDLWIAHAYALTHNEKSIERFHEILEKYNLKLVAAGLGLGGTQTNRTEVERDFTTLVRLGVPLLAGTMQKDDVPLIAEWCEKYGVRAAIENHPEKHAEEILEKIGDYGKWIGACTDTGWWGTQGADAVREVIILRDHLFHVHLKDVREVGAHHTCAFGEGIANIKGVLNVLDKINYSGFISVEHEPEYKEPMEDVKKSCALVLKHFKDLERHKTEVRHLRVAVIGAGGIWKFHAKNLWQTPHVEVVAHCDIDEQRAKETASKLGGKAFSNAEIMLNEIKPDAVWICTPQGVRLEPSQACVARSIPFFCEKPPAFDMKAALEISSLLKGSNLLHSMGFMWRILKMTQRARELLGEQPIPIVQSRLTCGVLLNSSLPAWFLLKERSGGQIVDQAIHILDLLRYFLGEVRYIYASGGNVVKKKSPTLSVEDSTALVLEFESGTIGTHAHSWAVNQYIAEIEFFSPKLVLKLDYVRNRLCGTLDGKPIDEQYDDDPYLTEAECFIEAVRAQRMDHIRSTYFDAVKTLAVALAGNRSLESGRLEQVESS
jgi:predicted dehydrogenase/sugar phosphate isomerase/epimerase